MLLKFSTKTRKAAVAAVGAAALTTIALTSGATAASAKAAPSGAVHGNVVTHGLVRSNLACAGAGGQDDSGNAIVSQDFTDGTFDAYDAQGADDFTVTAKCKISVVTAYGQYFNGVGPADSENVTIYSGKKTPGAVVQSYNIVGKDLTGNGTFKMKLPAPLKLKPGHYWLSVQAVMAFGSGGEWGWEATATSQNGQAAQWQNPGDGFGTGCTVYANMENCLGNIAGPDLLFSLA